MKPHCFSQRDTDLMLGLLYGLPKGAECLEWGCGTGTIFFVRELLPLNPTVRWTSVEHSKEWHGKVSVWASFLPINVKNVPVPDESTDAVRANPMDDYVALPATLDRKFDFIFIDGRKRRRCLIAASKILSPGGVVVLHDAERPHYHCAFEHYIRHSRIGDKLWVGHVDLPA
jgi:predicted O-methyltransferase YrrM